MIDVLASDPEPIKNLKRHLTVAIVTEDYTEAARLRDHPLLVMWRRIQAMREEGMGDEALLLEKRLLDLVASDANSQDIRPFDGRDRL